MEFKSRVIGKLLEAAGVDFVVIDMEHGSYSISDVADIIGWFKDTSVEPFVRVPELKYYHIARALDIGAKGVLVPNVKNAKQANEIVDAVKYPPLGKRGACFGGLKLDFKNIDVKKQMEFFNKNTTIMCQIESPEGVYNLEEIAQVTGLDALWVGHFDLTQYMGIPGDFKNPKFIEAIKKVVDTAHKSKLMSIIKPGNIKELEIFLQIGFDIFSYGVDYMVYLSTLTNTFNKIRAINIKGI
jgi:2-keto-3-deoxy-L-rhamnonate aldolase RhmA